MNYELGQVLRWHPHYWKWDVERDVTVTRVYRRGEALLSNNVIVGPDGLALIYDGARYVGRVKEPVM